MPQDKTQPATGLSAADRAAIARSQMLDTVANRSGTDRDIAARAEEIVTSLRIDPKTLRSRTPEDIDIAREVAEARAIQAARTAVYNVTDGWTADAWSVWAKHIVGGPSDQDVAPQRAIDAVKALKLGFSDTDVITLATAGCNQAGGKKCTVTK